MARVLIVDDSMVIRRLLNKVLSENGHEVVEQAKDGAHGVEAYRRHSPDAVILDITMPNKSGSECLQEILEMDSNAKVLMFTSVSDSNTVQECLDKGAQGYIRKSTNIMEPESANEILEKLSLALQGKAA